MFHSFSRMIYYVPSQQIVQIIYKCTKNIPRENTQITIRDKRWTGKILDQKQLLSVKSVSVLPRSNSSPLEIQIWNPGLYRIISCQHKYLMANGNMHSQFLCEKKKKFKSRCKIIPFFCINTPIEEQQFPKRKLSLRSCFFVFYLPMHIVLTFIKLCLINSKSGQSLTASLHKILKLQKILAQSKRIP